MAERKIIGNKTTFAIEYAVQITEPDYIGQILLWVNGNYIGTIDDTAHLQTVASVLIDLLYNHTQYTFPETQGKTNKQIFEMVKGENRGEFYHLILGDTFDDFSMTASVCETDILWQLHDDPYFNYPNYPTKLLTGDIPIDDFSKVSIAFGCAVEVAR